MSVQVVQDRAPGRASTTLAAGPLAAGLAPVFDELIERQGLPGMLVAVARGDQQPVYVISGADGAGRPLAADTLFPVASITKLATALAILRLAAAGTLGLDDPLARHLPDAAAAVSGVTLRAVLCHTAGLPDDIRRGAAPYQPGLDWPALARACLRTPLARPPRTLVQYSNLGPGLLAIIVERLTGQRFPDALQELVLRPLGVEGYLGAEPPRLPARIAGNYDEHTGTPLEPYNSPFWRSLALPWGGLLTTAQGALGLLRAFAGMAAGFLPPALLREATSDQTGGLSGGLFPPLFWPDAGCPWGLGVELRGGKRPHWTPPAAAPGSFGHAGASGCLVWYEPSRDIAWAQFGPHRFESWFERWPAIGAAILVAAGQP